MKKLALIAASALLPVSAFAQDVTGVLSKSQTWVTSLGNIVNLLIPIVFALALLGFFWGLVKYIFGGAEEKDKAKNIMIWGIVALFVMASVWGLVRFIQNSFGVQGDNAPSSSGLVPR